jgi:hypothetical protein
VKSFFGLSENAVKTQIWIAACAYVRVAMASRVAFGSALNKTLQFEQSMSRILQVVSVNIFSKDPIHQLLMKNETRNSGVESSNQLMLNDS